MKGRSKKQKVITEQDLRQVLIKKALGYDATEVVEEYVGNEEGDVKLTKKKGDHKKRSARYNSP